MRKSKNKFIKTPSYRDAEAILNEFQPRNENYLRALVTIYFGNQVASVAEYGTLRNYGRKIFNLAKKISRGNSECREPFVQREYSKKLEQLSLFQ